MIEKPAYRHLLYNSTFKSYWKIGVILWLAESFRAWSSCDINETDLTASEVDLVRNNALQDHCNFYNLLLHTAFAFVAFICTVVAVTELKWFIIGKKPYKYSIKDLSRALIVGGCGQLLGFLGIVWRHIASGPYYLLIQGYTVLCLLTTYSGKNPFNNVHLHKTFIVLLQLQNSHSIYNLSLINYLIIHIFWYFFLSQLSARVEGEDL